MHRAGFHKGTQGKFVALGFDMTKEGDWKPLVVHGGELRNMPGFTSLTGTVLHTINTEPGWSGTPIYKCESPGALSPIAAMHICAVPGMAAFNAAVSAPQLELLIRSVDNSFTPTYNCPFQDLIVLTNEGDEDSIFFTAFLQGDEKPTRKQMGTEAKRRARALKGKARGKQTGAPKQNARKGGKLGGWKHRKGGSKTKGGGVKSSQLSPATYDKLKQASSLFASKDPRAMGMVHRAYRKLVELEDRLEIAQANYLNASDAEERAEAEGELEQLRAHQEAVMRNFEHQLEGKMQEYARRAALQQPQSSNFAPRAAWAYMYDSEAEEDDQEDQSFWGGRDPYNESKPLRPGTLIYKNWGDHDPDAEAVEVEQMNNDEARRGPAAAYPESVPGEETATLNQGESVRKACVRKLLAMSLSTGDNIDRHLVERVASKYVDSAGRVVAVESDLWTYLMNRLTHTDYIHIKASDGEYYFFDIVPEDPGSPGDLLVSRYKSDDFKTATKVQVVSPPPVNNWWNEVFTGDRYFGDVGGSENVEQAPASSVIKGDQKRFQAFYRDYVDQSMDNILPHRKLVRECPSEDKVSAALDRFFTVEGKMSDLYEIMNCGVDCLWSRPEAEEFRAYMRLGEPVWNANAKEVIPDSKGDPCFRKVGKHTVAGGNKPPEEMSELSRRVKSIISKIAEQHPEAEADLLTASSYVMPPTGECALIDSLKGQSTKQKIAQPSSKLRQFLRYISFDAAKDMPLARWAFDSFPVGEILSHFIDVADDKAIGWTSHLFPGTRGNIQKDIMKRNTVVRLTKFRMALRFSLANSLHSLSPAEMVRAGLRDPCMAFIKPEGHPVRKRETKTWRLIWVVSELDRLIDASVFTEQDKADIIHYQTGPRAEHGVVKEIGEKVCPLSMGVGHDDANLERTFYELETLLAKSPTGEIHCSDATGWDLSVSAASFWSALEMRLCRAKSDVQTAAYLVNAFFQQAWVVSTGTYLWESYRFGITASGSSITTSANTEERQMGSKAASDIEALGGMVEFEKLEPHEMKELSQTDDSQRTAAGDDLLNARKHSNDVISALGTIERGSKICNGTPERPIEYLSHLYFKKDGKWRCLRLQLLYAQENFNVTVVTDDSLTLKRYKVINGSGVDNSRRSANTCLTQFAEHAVNVGGHRNVYSNISSTVDDLRTDVFLNCRKCLRRWMRLSPLQFRMNYNVYIGYLVALQLAHGPCLTSHSGNSKRMPNCKTYTNTANYTDTSFAPMTLRKAAFNKQLFNGPTNQMKM